MTGLSDAAVERLRVAAMWPEFTSDRYAVIEAIGRGGMGTVYRATDHLLGREVAVKVPNGFGDGPTGERLWVEAGVLARLEHPGIVPIHDAGHLADGRLFYVMKLVRGETLREHLTGHRDLSERLGLFERICEPVAFAHAHGLVHRDLKPDNIMLGTFGEVLVMDWGAALLADPPRGIAPAPTGEPSDARVIGTRGFMAPEQAASDQVDARADVYGLGAVLFLLLTGEMPPDRDAAARLATLHDVPVALRAICDRAMAPDPARRYLDVVSLAHDVRRYRAGLAVDAHRETLIERAMRLGRVYRTAIVLVAAYLLMRVVVALSTGR